MKKIIKEQNVGSDFIGKTVNWYKDANNTIQAASGVIKAITPKKMDYINGYEIVVTSKEIGKKTSEHLKLFFHCMGTVGKLAGAPKKVFLVLGQFDREIGIVFNDNLFDALVKKFCSVSKGGTVVPKADFASVGTETGEPMAEGKKVIRLTESDLVQLVKRIISEKK